jgi:hypothetical protein
LFLTFKKRKKKKKRQNKIKREKQNRKLMNKFEFIEKLTEENSFYFLYGFRNYLSPTKLMEKLLVLMNDSNNETKER